MTTTMSISVFKETAQRLPADTSILLRANHGVGKSQVIRQLAASLRAEKGWGVDKFPVIDRRAGQLTEGDVIGLPSTDGEVTRFNPPDWYKRACVEPCCLFLDELNRGTTEVMQAMFQIVLDRELNGWKLHPETRVYSAINNGSQYQVNEIDPALLDRFWVIDLAPSAAEFIAWARSSDPVHGGNLHFFVPDFIEASGGETWLYPAKSHEPGNKQPSPRSWERVAKALVHAGVAEQPDSETFFHICRGYVGNEGAIAFKDFCKTVDFQITGEEIINKYHTKAIKAKVERNGNERLNGLIEKAADYVVGTLDKLDERQGKNVAAFMTFLPAELRIVLWSKLCKQGIAKIELAKSVHKHCAALILDIFQVPMGEAGIGVTPNIPGMLRPAAKEAKEASEA